MKVVILATLLLVAFAEVIPFNNDAINKIFKESNDALILFLGDSSSQASQHEAFKQLDATNPGVVLTVSAKDDGHGLFQRLAEYVGVDVSSTPKVLFLNNKQQKFRFSDEQITSQTLSTFLAKIKNGQIQPFLKSAQPPASNDGHVKIIVGKTFKDFVLNSDKQVLVKFYAPWCGHCKTLAPHYDEAAELIAANPNILLAKVDSTENQIAGVDIQGFPTLKFWGKDKSVDPIDYNGGRDVEGIISWLKEHTQYEWVEPSVQEQAGEQEQVQPQAEL